MSPARPGLTFPVSDLVGRPGERCRERGVLPIDLQVGESRISGDAHADVTLEGIDDGVLARFEARATATLVCTRCLTEWSDDLVATAMQVFEPEPDEDGYALGAGDTVDLSGPVRDELALAVPFRPLCRHDCAGLCPTCGSDLNTDPCGGHEEPSTSPFAGLKDLLEDDRGDDPRA